MGGKPTYAELEARVEELEAALEGASAAESAQRLSGECLARAFRSGPLLMLITRLEDGLIVDANDAFARATGYERDDLIGSTTADLQLWANDEQRAAVVHELQTAGRARDFEVDVRTRSGELLSALFSAALIELDGVAHLVCVASDMADRLNTWRVLKDARVELEQMVEDRAAALESANQQLTEEIAERKLAEERLGPFEVFVEASADGMGWATMDGLIRYANPGLCRMLDAGQEELLGKPVQERYSEATQSRLQEEVFPKVLTAGSWTGELELHSVTGRVRTTLNSLFLLRDAEGNPKMFANVVTDLTERKRAEEELRKHRERLEELVAERTADLRRANRELQQEIGERRRIENEKAGLEEELRHSQKMEAIGRLAGGVAHDFNNLLTGINGYAEMIQLRLEPDDPLLADVGEIRTAAERAQALTNQLLAFSRKQLLAPEVLKLSDAVAHSEKMLRRIIGEHIEMSITHGEGAWSTYADPGQIDQILVNLAVNSRDAMPGGGTLVIETQNVTIEEDYARRHEATAGDFVMMSISDTGTGMAEETRARIFEPFFTTKPRGEGTGLGLSTVYGLAKQSQGFVHVYTEEGIGTTFKVFFPRVPEDTTEAPTPALGEIPHGNETVLLVEDEEIVRTLAERILAKLGYQVLSAHDGSSACAAAQAHPGEIDLLLTDVVMPRMNGRQLCERLREDRPRLRVLYMSGYTENTIGHNGVLDRGTSFLAKPFTVDDLARKVREALDKPFS